MRTTISINPETKEALNKKRRGGETWDDFMARLLGVKKATDLDSIPYRYWVNLGYWDPDCIDDLDEITIAVYSEIHKKIEALSPDVEHTVNGGLQFKTTDLAETQALLEKAADITREYGQDAPEFGISTQPICPDCHTLGRFKDQFCSECSTELIG